MDILVAEVVAASRLPARDRTDNVKPAVAALASLSYEHGVLSGPLRELISLVTTSTHLDQASVGAIVRSLYPVEAVTDEDVLRVVGCLGHGLLKPGLPVQALLLRWLIMVYPVLEGQAILSRAYPILFNLLDTAVIRPQLCHLLALVTRRKHVRPFRIQWLLELSRNTGSDPPLVGLLRIYKNYYPEIVVGTAVRGRASAFKHPDLQWRTRLDEIRHAHAQATVDASGGGAQNGFRVNRRPLGRAQRRAVPGVHTAHATEESVTLEEIDSADTFVAKLHRIELPTQLVAMLTDPLLRKLLVLRPSHEANARIGNWLGAFLQDAVTGDADAADVAGILEAVRDYVVSTEHVPNVVLGFFKDFLPTWNGKTCRREVLDMLPHVPLLSFEDLYQHLFRPLERAILDNTPESLLVLFEFYASLGHNWIGTLRDPGCSPPQHAASAVAGLTEHVNRLAVNLLQARPGVSTELAILSYYYHVSSLFVDPVLYHRLLIVHPPAPLVYLLLFSHSSATYSHLCGIMATYKRAFELAMEIGRGGSDSSPSVTTPTSGALPYDRTFVNRFNSFLMDTCNCLWRSRAFSITDTNALGCLLPRPLIPRLTSYVAGLEPAAELPSIFSLSLSPVTCRLAIQSLRAHEDRVIRDGKEKITTRHMGPVSQNSLRRLGDAGGVQLTWLDYRSDVLKALEEDGLGGVSALMKTTMKILNK